MPIKMMPVLDYNRKPYNQYSECPREVPFDMLNEETAMRNHSQTLDRLRERGGLSITEIIWNITFSRIDFNMLDGEDRMMFVISRVEEYKANQRHKSGKLIPGYNFLEEHRKMQHELDVPEDHVIVDKADWQRVVSALLDNPSVLDAKPNPFRITGMRSSTRGEI